MSLLFGVERFFGQDFHLMWCGNLLVYVGSCYMSLSGQPQVYVAPFNFG